MSDATSAALPEDKRFRSHLRLALPMYHAIRWIVFSTSQLLYEHPNNVSSAFNVAWAWAFGAVLVFLWPMLKKMLDLIDRSGIYERICECWFEAVDAKIPRSFIASVSLPLPPKYSRNPLVDPPAHHPFPSLRSTSHDAAARD